MSRASRWGIHEDKPKGEQKEAWVVVRRSHPTSNLNGGEGLTLDPPYLNQRIIDEPTKINVLDDRRQQS